MSVPSMLHRSEESLLLRSVESGGDASYGSVGDANDSDAELQDSSDDKDLPECKIKRNYSCGTCDYFTQNPRHFLYHLRDVHKEKVRIYECPNCLYASKHFQKLLRHTKMVHGTTDGVELPDFPRPKGKKRKSPEEGRIDEDSLNMTDEGEEPPEGNDPDKAAAVLKCSLCTFTARNQPQLGKHEREEHIKTKFFRCTKCTYVTHMKARFTKHVKYHSMPMIKCELCDFRTPYKWNLDRHCKNHNGRGPFRCSACNFSADIKQSLTVHEMNHHVPPVGQAAGLGVGRRRNKVGASDSAEAEEAAQVSRGELESNVFTDDGGPNKKAATQKLKIPAAPNKKLKTANNPELSARAFGSDFIHPDDIIHHANGNIYIKNKCKLCNYKSAWDGEMAKHEQKAHNIVRDEPAKNNGVKKSSRPVPNLIPIPTQTSLLKQPVRSGQSVLKEPSAEPIMSQKDMNEICAKSANSALKDFASLFGSEDVFNTDKKENSNIPDLIPASLYSPKATSPRPPDSSFKHKNASFFDRLKEKLMTGAGESCNLTCQYCGYESKCLSESAGHQKTCGKLQQPTHNLPPIHNLSSTRCQYCRQRCKSSTDLYNHLQSCPEAVKSFDKSKEPELEITIQPEADVKLEEEIYDNKPHPMENRVFVWNNIEVPMDIDVDEEPQFEYLEDKQEDNASLDLSIRTNSPISESSYLGTEITSNSGPVTEKIPTHGNDISVAQHKRVFKCPHCSFWASTASRFHVHIVGHLNKKPFECSLCAYRSNWRWDITKHIKLKSVRDPAHEKAKVLMTDETGRRNYTKYNKYLTEIQITGDHTETSGGAGTRPKVAVDLHETSPSQYVPIKTELPKLTRAPSSSDFSPLLRNSTLRPPPPLKAADGLFFAKISSEKKRPSTENKKTLWKCKKCNFRDASHEKLLAHVKGHYLHDGGIQGVQSEATSGAATPENDERHCRLKHSGDIRVVIGTKNGTEKVEMDDQIDEPDHVDLPQLGTFKCKQCPFSNNNNDEFELHLTGHNSRPDGMKCFFCTFYISNKEELYEHLKLHGISDPDESRVMERNDEPGKRHKCATCPYVTNSKSQYLYHKQFHKPRGGQYTCSYCSYNVSKRHLLHQHLKVHGINVTPQKQNGEVIDLDEMPDDLEEINEATPSSFDSQNFPDIPLVWVSKNEKFSKMFKCRFCPHVNLRKVNIQEHEKMHSLREKNSGKVNEIEHHCSECNYVCNNAGVLSSHSKVHQGLYGQIHCLVDPTKSDDEQINQLGRFLSVQNSQDIETINLDDDYGGLENNNLDDDQLENNTSTLYFCNQCPARFLKDTEFVIHNRFHGVRLFYKCDYCSYTARQKPHLLAHNKVHTQDYQDRTNVLKTIYDTSPQNPPPKTILANSANGTIGWIVENADCKKLDDYEPPKIQRSSMNVPLSGTELFQQRSEAQKQNAERIIVRPNDHFPPAPLPVDPQFGTLMHGNPNFIYPTYLKNGRMKEKRYKCHKCPSAFEKREQYKVHLSLHGSKQRYKCDHCDYSVKYYANYVQHLKKHQMNADAHAARKEDECEGETEEVVEESVETTGKAGKSLSSKRGPLKLSLAERQALMFLQKRRGSSSSSNKDTSTEDRKLFWCPSCPYTNYRKDALDNHQKRHISVSGFTNNYTCEHCDYSVPQAHFLREHVKLHFLPNKVHQTEGFMMCDKMKLSIKKVDDEADKSDVEKVIFEDKGVISGEGRFVPSLNKEILRRLNNNVGEKTFINPETGEIVQKDAPKTDNSNESQVSTEDDVEVKVEDGGEEDNA